MATKPNNKLGTVRGMSGARNTSRLAIALAAATVAALALIPVAAARAERGTTATAATVQVRGGEFFFKLSTKSAAKPGTVTFVFKNVGHVLHDFKIAGKKTPLIRPSKTARLVVTFKRKGRYPYVCTVPGHAQAGMKGVFTVR
jgi:uncharacterized cupredoxin-like copper-binding protein